jgi:hypothetical protein
VNKGGAFHVVCGILNIIMNLVMLGVTLSRTSKEYAIKYLEECNPKKEETGHEED